MLFTTRLLAATATSALGLGALAHGVPTTADEGRAVELDARILSLAPDGRWLAGWTRTEDNAAVLCVSDVASLAQGDCANLDARDLSMDDNSVVWSPDSGKLAFAETALRTNEDGDLWVMDVATGELTNLTDDGFAGTLPIVDDGAGADGVVHVDVLPAWSPDGRSIAASRSTIVDGEPQGNEIVAVDVESGDVESLTVVSPDEFAIVSWSLEWSPDGTRLYYTVDLADDEQANGVWALDVARGDAQLLIPLDAERGPVVLYEIAAGGSTGLAFYTEAFSYPDPRMESWTLADLDSGALVPIDANADDPDALVRITSATFSPAGDRLLTARWDQDRNGLVEVLGLPDGKAVEVASSETWGPYIVTLGGGLDWASDGTVFLSTNPDTGRLFQLDADDS